MNLDQCLGANRPLVFVTCESDIEVLRHILKNYPDNDTYVYSTTIASLQSLSNYMNPKGGGSASGRQQDDAMSTIQVLDRILTSHGHRMNPGKKSAGFTTYIFLDVDMWMHDAQNVRKIKDILHKYTIDEEFTVNLVMLSGKVCVPMALERLAEMVNFDLPSEKELKDLSDNLTKKLELKDDKAPSEEVVNNLKGMTLFEEEQAYLQSHYLFKGIKLDFIRDFKKNAIAKTDLLALLDTSATFDDIGGLDRLKQWVMKSAGGSTVEGKKFGLPLLKGILLVGLPGCGKSLSAKALGNQWGLPVVDFDPSRVFSSRVGDSETNMRRVVQIVENLSPCLMGDTRITLSNGQVASIKELYDAGYRGEVISLNASFEQEPSNVIMITKKRSQEVFNIRTNIGNIKATGNHKFPVLMSKGELHWIAVSDLKAGQFLVCPREVKVDSAPSLLALDYLSDDTRLYSKSLCRQVMDRMVQEKVDHTTDIRRIRGEIKGSREWEERKNRCEGFVLKSELNEFNINCAETSHIDKIARGDGGFQDSSLPRIPALLDEGFFYLLGLLWSDGNLGDRGYWFFDKTLKDPDPIHGHKADTTGFYNNEDSLHTFVVTYVEEAFGIRLTTDSKKKCKVTRGFPIILGELLRRVQKEMLSMPNWAQWAWLAGVMDGDGHIHKQRVNYAARKYMNNEYLRDMLLRVGLQALSYKDDFKNTCVELTSSRHIHTFAEKATLIKYPKKINDLATLSSSVEHPKCRMDSMDLREALIDAMIKDGALSIDSITVKGEFRNQSVIVKDLSPELKRCFHEYVDRERCIDSEKIKELFKAVNAGDEWFLKGDLFFTPILEVNPIHGEHDVYDLCLDKNHNFIANRMYTHNCIMMIDEIEKGLAGLQSSSYSDSGVTARVIRSFLVWMQECQKPVFTVATANNISNLPPEMISRFDEVFFVNLPQLPERKDIFNIHIRKLARDPAKFDLTALAEASQDLSGREIEQVLKDAMYASFHAGVDLKTEAILDSLKHKTTLVTTMAEQLKAIIKWVGWDQRSRMACEHGTPASQSPRMSHGSEDEIDNLLKEIESNPLPGADSGATPA